MLEGSASESTEVQDRNHQYTHPDYSNLSKTAEHCPLQHENEVDKENKQEDGNGNEEVPEEEDEDEDADFNPFLKETNSIEASSSLSSEVEDLDLDVADSREKHRAAFDNKSQEKHRDITNDCHTSGNVDNGGETVMQTTVSDLACGMTTDKGSALITQSENGSLLDKENGLACLDNLSNAADPSKPMVDMDTEEAICMRTRARYSLASFTLDELETFLQETDDEDDLQNVDDEEEYRKFLAAVLRGDDSQNLQGNAHADDEDEENDADFELELEEALESEPEEVEERRMTRRNRSQKASVERSKKLSGQLNRPLRPLLPFASIGTFSGFDGKNFTPSISPSYMPPVNNGYTCGFTPHQIGQLHCLIHEHVQLLIQVFSMCVLEPGKGHIASEVKELVVQMRQKRDQVLAWRTVPYPSFCFFPPYVHPSVSDGIQKMLPFNGSSKNVQQDSPSGSNRVLHSDIISMSGWRHNYPPDEQDGSSQSPECTSWVPYICGPVLSVMDVAPLRLVENYIDDISSAVRAYERYQIELGFETRCQKEPLFPLRNSLCPAESDGQGEMENTPSDSTEMLSPSSSQMAKKTMAATLLEKAKNQSVALVPKEIAKLAQRFWPLFNPVLYPHKPPPAPVASRVLFTDAEDELLALGLMEYNTDWKAIQQRFLPCKSKHQIFVRQKNRASSKAPENPIKAVRRIKNSPLTSEEIARIEVGLKKFKLDWISIWRFFVPYRDPSLLPRQWRIASGTQKSYKSDANKKEKRRLYELRRKHSKPSTSTWHSSSEKEGDSTDNAVEETNSVDNRMDNEDEAYVHEAFLADWTPENNVSSSFQTRLPSGEGPQACEQKDNSGYGDIPPPACSKSPAALRSSNSEVVLLRPYRARRPNSARLVKLAPDLPPVNLPPSVRVMSQSAFKSSQAVPSAKIPGNASRVAGMVAENRAPHARNTINSGVGSSVASGPNRNNSVNITDSSQHRNHSDVAIDKCIAERGDSDLQMHPLLFQAPQDGHLPYYPSSTTTSSSFTFFSGKQPQLSLSLFHNPRHIRDAVNFLSKSSKPPEKNASTLGVDFHPLLQRAHDVDADSVAAHPAGRLPSTAETRQRSASIRNPSASSSKPSLDGITSALGTKVTSLGGNVNELDLNMHLSFTSKNPEAAESRNTTLPRTGISLSAPTSGVRESESAKDSSRTKDSAPVGMGGELDSGDIPLVTSRSKGSRKISDNLQDESLPEIIMEQEELSDSEEELGDNVEFECEEMADSEGESTSDSEQVVDMPNEEVHLDETDADIGDGRVLNTHSDSGGNTCSTSDRHSIGLALADKGVNIKRNAPSLNLNSCPPVSSYSNPKSAVAAYEFGPFGHNQLLVDSKGSDRYIKPSTGQTQRRLKDDASEHDTLPRKRVCRSNSNSSVAVCGKGNSSSNMDRNVQNLKNVSRDEFG